MTWKPPSCDCGCGKQAVKHYRLNPTNWLPTHAILSLPCGKAMGYTRMDYTRPSVSGTRLRTEA